MRIAIVCILLGFALCVAGLTGARAKTSYAAKEKKACTYCHVRPNGGSQLTEAGRYYRSHGRSLQGFKGNTAVKPPAPANAAGKSAGTKAASTPPAAARTRRGEDEDEREEGEREHRRSGRGGEREHERERD